MQMSMQTMNKWNSESEDQMVELGARFGAALSTPMIIGLSGSLGAGKTTFVRGVLKQLGYQGKVKSPSYTLMETYDLGGYKLLHCDFYRLHSPSELEYLSLRDESSSAKYSFMEWPDKGAGVAPPLDLIIHFNLQEELHTLDFEPLSASGQALVQSL